MVQNKLYHILFKNFWVWAKGCIRGAYQYHYQLSAVMKLKCMQAQFLWIRACCTCCGCCMPDEYAV